MNNQLTPHEQLQSFLNKLFQFESQELDFGVYKILHYKRNEIKQFINELLVDKVKEQLQVLSQAQSQEALHKLQELEHDDIIKGWLSADENEKSTLLKFGKDKIEHYQELQQQVQSAHVSIETENLIYNHLTLFFSRYYDKGDFISKRRFGKNEKYVVPYNGEETHFYWANQDQYYIKSSESFQKYAFKVPHGSGNLIVNFKLTEAETEQGNVKANETRYFILSAKPAELSPSPSGEGRSEVLNIFFEYRSFTDAEKKTYTGNNKQDALDIEAADKIKATFKNEPLCINLWATDNKGESLLLQHLHRYTRKNSYDFFIHKNLKGFLQRELDFYIKSELVNVDDLYVSETDEHFNRIKHNLKTIKVFKLIADTIIEFLAQLEEFQKKLWEKKKFVLSTEWVITIDRLVEYIGIEAATPLLVEVIANQKQLDEWIDLFGKENIPAAPITIDLLKADAFAWRKFPIDTVNFPALFKENLLNALSAKINLDEKADGLIIHSDNYHGLKLVKMNFQNKINVTYIDPPYNTSASEIIYKNSFKNSSWITFIQDRISQGRELMKVDGNLCVTIDDVQFKELAQIVTDEFGASNLSGTVSIRANPSGRPTEAGFAIAHEYALFVKNSTLAKIRKIPRTDGQKKRYNEIDDESIFEWRNLRREGSNSNREDGKRQWYPIYADIGKGSIRVPKMTWDDLQEAWIIHEKANGEETIVYPINEDGVEKNWRWSEENVRNDYSQFESRLNNKQSAQIYYKYRPNTEGVTPLTFWADAKYSATEHGTKMLKELFGICEFSYPKSVWAVKDCIYIMGNERHNLILDYFPGSGTTFHATQLLNNEDKGSRKCILIEQGDYIYTVIIPRIKKVAYSFDWKDGKPKNGSMNGLGAFLKYQRLEQYEEALENIAFTASGDSLQKALEFDQYIPKYFLQFETQGSPALVNTNAMANPWVYSLKVWDGYTYDNEQPVDLVETFNYLIGLHMQKCVTKQINGNRYQFVAGHNNAGKQLLVVWRNTTGWQLPDYEADRLALLTELKAFTYDQLYISGQAHIEGYQPIEEIFKNKMLS